MKDLHAGSDPALATDRGPDDADLAERFENASMRFGRTMAHRVLERIGSDLTMPQYHILRMTVAAGDVRASELAERLGIQPSAVTAMVDRLVAKGLAERVRDTDDRRVVHVRATPAGRDQLREVGASLRTWFRQVFAGLEPGEAEEFVRLFEMVERVASRPV
jgi:DNA-binding MarR family transcriptional regulator